MKEEVEVKVKVGDRICIVNPVDTYGEYENGDEGAVTSLDESGVSVFFDHFKEGSGSMYVLNEEFEVISGDGSGISAESLRNSILNIRKEREELVKQLEGIDDKENEAIQKLAGLGFLLKEEPESTPVSEDMTDPENWKIGDMFEVLSTENAGLGKPEDLKVGDVLPLTKTGVHSDEASFKLGHDCSTWVRARQIKFHSRPL